MSIVFIVKIIITNLRRLIAMKRFLAFVVALMMVVSLFAACADNTDDTPQITLSADSGNTDDGSGGDETDDTGDDSGKYESDSEGIYFGMVGIGSNGASAMFKSLSVGNMATSGTEIWSVDLDSDDPLGEFSYATALDGNWDSTSGGIEVISWSDSASDEEETGDEAETEAEDDSYNVISIDGGSTGVMAYAGNKLWNYIQYKFQVYVTEIGGGIVFYFGVTDESNYYACVVGGDDNTTTTVYQVTNGTATVLESMLYKVPTEEWFYCSATVYRDHIRIYLAGQMLFDLFAKSTTTDTYYGSVGLGQWSTANTFDNLVVTSNETGEVLYENDFSDASSISDFEFMNGSGGNWDTEIEDDDGNTYTMADVWTDYWVIQDSGDSEYGNALSCTTSSYYGGIVTVTEGIGNEEWTDYTIDVDVRRDSGAECWLVIFNCITVNDYAWFNIGGWSNTLSTFEYVVEGEKKTMPTYSDTYDTGVWYHVTLIVKPGIVYGYVDGELVLTYSS